VLTCFADPSIDLVLSRRLRQQLDAALMECDRLGTALRDLEADAAYTTNPAASSSSSSSTTGAGGAGGGNRPGTLRAEVALLRLRCDQLAKAKDDAADASAREVSTTAVVVSPLEHNLRQYCQERECCTVSARTNRSTHEYLPWRLCVDLLLAHL